MSAPVTTLRQFSRAMDRAGVAREAAYAAIAERAAGADRGTCDLGDDIGSLREAGLLRAVLPVDAGGDGLGLSPETAVAASTVLRRIGRANLSVARLFEGHVNAVKLLSVYATPEQRATWFGRVADGALLAVWGADAPQATVTLHAAGVGLRSLSGAKCFASGLGVVDAAIVTAATDAGVQMVMVPTSDTTRADVSGWATSGMRATASGTYRLDGIATHAEALLGGPGDYHREPHFQGGVWRYCAAQLGGAEALTEILHSELKQRGRADDAHQMARFARAVAGCGTARMWVERAAAAVERPGAGETDVACALLAREVVEQSCLDVVAMVDRSLGAASYFVGHPAERIRRDLGMFLRQAAPDAKLQQAAASLFACPDPLDLP